MMIAFYLWATGRRLPERPEDNPGGEIAEFEGEYGFFSPHSWWPLPLAAAAAVCFLGIAVGWWMFIIGAAFGVVAGEVLEGPSDQGDHAEGGRCPGW